MAYVYIPDPQYNYPQGPQYPQYPQQPPQTPIYIPNPPHGKKDKKPSLKQLFRAKMQIEELMKNVEEHNKKNKKEDKKKRDGLNWIELSLLLIFISVPLASMEIIGALALVKTTGLLKLIQ